MAETTAFFTTTFRPLNAECADRFDDAGSGSRNIRVERARLTTQFVAPETDGVTLAKGLGLIGDRRNQVIVRLDKSCDCFSKQPASDCKTYSYLVIESPNITADLKAGGSYSLGGLAAASGTWSDAGMRAVFVVYADYEGQRRSR